MEPYFSVIIPTYNRCSYVTEAVASVLGQTYQPLEIIVVDDGSTDDTQSVLEPYYNHIHYIHQSNLGVSAARNVGIRCATGNWLAFLDSDDTWDRDYLATQALHIKEHPHVRIHITNLEEYNEFDGTLKNLFVHFGLMDAYKNQHHIIINKPIICVFTYVLVTFPSIVIDHSLIEQVGMFKESLRVGEDSHLMARLVLRSPLGITTKPLVRTYRRIESTEHLTKDFDTNRTDIHETFCSIFFEILSMPGVDAAEQKFFRQKIGANKRAMGNAMLRANRVREARRFYRQAWLWDKSLASLGRLSLSYLPCHCWLMFEEKMGELTHFR